MGTLGEKLSLVKANKKLIHIFISSLVFILIVIFFFLGVSIGKSQSEKISQSEDGNNLKNELVLCLENKASMGAPMNNGNYNFETFKVYSPLLEDKNVSKTEFEYKRALITSQAVQINENTKVKTWVLEKPSGYLPPLPERLKTKLNPYDLTYAHADFPIIDGYEFIENINDENFVSARIPENSTQSNIYVSKKGIKMYRKSSYGPKSLDAKVELDFYANVNEGKTPVFGQIIYDLTTMNMNQEITAKDITKVFQEIESIADTISFEKY